jgi:hypothetical protein
MGTLRTKKKKKVLLDNNILSEYFICEMGDEIHAFVDNIFCLSNYLKLRRREKRDRNLKIQ